MFTRLVYLRDDINVDQLIKFYQFNINHLFYSAVIKSMISVIIVCMIMEQLQDMPVMMSYFGDKSR